MGPKIIKNEAGISQKVAPKTMLQLGSILDPTWLNFGRVLAPKLGTSWQQVALKIDAKNDQKTYHILDRFWNDFTGFWPPTWGSRGGPRTHFWKSFLAPGGFLGPSWAKMDPRLVQDAFWERFWTILAPNSMDFGL